MAIWKGKVIVMAKKNNAIVLTITEKRAKLRNAVLASTASSKEVASLLNDMIVNEDYREEGAENVSEWFKINNDCIEGIGYKQCKSLVDCLNHVWKHKELADIPCGTASALVSACKKDSAKIIALAKAGKITPTTPQKIVRELLVKEGLRKDSAKVVAKGTDTIVDDIAIVEKALKVVLASLEKKGKVDEKARLVKAWDNIKVAVDK